MTRRTTPRPKCPGTGPAPREFSLGHIAAMAVPAGLVAIGAILLLGPAERLGLPPTSPAGFAADFVAAVLLFAGTFAFLAPVVDLAVAWGRATPGTERGRGGDGGDGGD